MAAKLFILIFLILLLFYQFNLYTLRYVSPYTLDVYFGKKGCGKSSTLQKLATRYYSKGWTCYCDRSDSGLPFVHQIDADFIYAYKFPPNSVIFVGEANLHWDNRDFKSFPKEMQRFFRKQRHKRVKVVLFSQTYDCDKKIRDLADRLYISKKVLRIFTFNRCYIKQPVIIPAREAHDTAKMADDYIRSPLFSKLNSVTFIPRWTSSFDSFEDS